MAEQQTGSEPSHLFAITAGAMAVALGAIGLCPTAADASIIVTTPNVDVATAVAPISLGGTTEFLAGVTGSSLKVLPASGNLVSITTLAAGSVIGPGTSFQSASLVFPPVPNADTFVGLDVVAGPDNTYGFADFGGSGGTVLKEYAFETTPNTPITALVPEPSPLTVLAMGAIAVLAIRRRSAERAA
ncbi:MAG: hypothetical protein WBQ75_15335 [Acetobacteraceae bacterium]